MRRSVWGRRQRFPRQFAVLAVLVAAAVLAFATNRLQSPSTPLVGHAEAIDGDTLRLGETHIRLVGLDAPELDQTCDDANGEWACGSRARAFVIETLARQAVSCEPLGRDVYGRTLARCQVAGADLGQAIVAAGWAVSTYAYLAEQASARTAARGIWSGNFTSPAVWRRDHGTGQPGPWEWIRSWIQ